MVRRFLLVGSVALLALPLAAQQQDTAAPPQQNPPAANSAQKKAAQKKDDSQQKPPASSRNPFPEAQSEAAAHQQQNDSPSAPQPAAQKSQSKPSPADQNPFPEAESQKAAHQEQQQENAAPGDASKSGSGQDYSSSQSGMKDLNLPGSTDTKTAAANGGVVLSPDLARQDTKVGHFYLQSGDYQGAYNRYKEAAHVDPGNADAVFGLAEAARHLNHRDEAVSNYKLYLSALPDGPKAKDARKALKEMGAEPKS